MKKRFTLVCIIFTGFLASCVTQNTIQGTQQGTQANAAQNPATAGRPIVNVVAPSGPLTRHIVVQAGNTTRIAKTFSVTSDCAFQTYNEIRVKDQPLHGTISVYHDTDYPEFPANNPHSVCNGLKLPGTVAAYTPAAGFTGVDMVSIEIITSGGRVVEARTSITVK